MRIEARMALARAHRQPPSYGSNWVNDGEPLIQVEERSNLIVSRTELRGLRYTPELEKGYRLMLKTKEVEEKLKNSNMHHRVFSDSFI